MAFGRTADAGIRNGARVLTAIGLMALALLSGLAFTGAASAQGNERIISYDSHVTINTDASLTVVETLRVEATGN